MFTPLAPLILGPAILLPLALYALRHRRVRGARWYAGLLVAIGFWSALYAWELMAGTPALSILAIKIKYIGVVALPVTWIGFILDFAARDPTIDPAHHAPDDDLRGAHAARLLVERLASPVLGPLLVERAPNGLSMVVGRGPGFWINTVYTYCAIWAGVGILLNQAVQSPYLYRKRAGDPGGRDRWCPGWAMWSSSRGWRRPDNVDSDAVPVHVHRGPRRDCRVPLSLARSDSDLPRRADRGHRRRLDHPRRVSPHRRLEQGRGSSSIGWSRAAAAGVAIERVLVGWPPLNGTPISAATSRCRPLRASGRSTCAMTPVRADRDRLTGLRGAAERCHGTPARRNRPARQRAALPRSGRERAGPDLHLRPRRSHPEREPAPAFN